MDIVWIVTLTIAVGAGLFVAYNAIHYILFLLATNLRTRRILAAR